jgi:RHS repeat-associated protein
MTQHEATTAPRDGPAQSGVPSISLPKSGGAVRGLGEKFAANPVTGTASLAVPIATSPGRSGFGPELSLSYDSGAGNGAFGFGWSLASPSISRKTDKGLPRYDDAADSDIFMLTGAEDLVPVFGADGRVLDDTTTVSGYTIRRYRPRIEGLFARIERWTKTDDGDVHWRSISSDNVLTVYGRDPGSRIVDPDETERVFSWLVSETRDDKGNAVLYRYKAEDGVGVDETQAHERHRTAAVRSANRYPKRILYGNRRTLLDGNGKRPIDLTQDDVRAAGWMFEIVFDYGEHDDLRPAPHDAGQWAARYDPFSTYRPGFEVRTHRLCRRALMFHHFPTESEIGQDCLVRSTTFDYRETPTASFIAAVTHQGHRRVPDGYVTSALPPLEFDYSEPVIGHELHDLDGDSLEHLPQGVDGSNYQWVDLNGEGLSGVIAEQGGAWYYKPNESPLARDGGERPSARLGPAEQLHDRPAAASMRSGRWRFVDLGGDGQVDVATMSPAPGGFYERTADRRWRPFRPFASMPTVSWDDPDLRLVDLTGDGHADVFVMEDQAISWYPSLGEDGFGYGTRLATPEDEARGPRLVFADTTETIFLADMSGDGLTDILRVRNGDVCYWPNLGYGRFGAKVTMDGAPHFDSPEQFDPRRIRLLDIDGSGPTDIVYLGQNASLWFNEAGNSWSFAYALPELPPMDSVASVAAVDLLGDGTACLVWSSPLPREAGVPMRYLRLMAGGKPHLLVGMRNNLGAEVRIRYAPSTYFALKDRAAGRPWITALPFPVHVVERIETFDHVSRNRFVTRYAYHHGHFDGDEREFRGFGMVEQWDTETFAALAGDSDAPAGENLDLATHVPPVLTRTWFHTGVYVGRDHVSDYFAGLAPGHHGEYYREPGLDDVQAQALLLPDTVLPDELSLAEEREACRALKGSMLRQEVYALDGTDREEHPYTVVERNHRLRRIQPHAGSRHAVFLAYEQETLVYHYERDPADPRVQHRLVLDVDRFGDVLREAAVGYGRRKPDPSLDPHDQAEQGRTLVTYTERGFTNPLDDPSLQALDHRTPAPCEIRLSELTGYTPTGPAGRYQASDLVAPTADGLTLLVDSELAYEEQPGSGRQRRTLTHSRMLYRPDGLGSAQDDAESLLPLGDIEPLALAGETYELALTPGLVEQVFQRGGTSLLPDPAAVLGGGGVDGGGYLASQELKRSGRFPASDPDDHWWATHGRAFLSPAREDTASQELAHARQHFFLAQRHRDAFHTATHPTETVARFDAHDLLVQEVEDALGSRVTAGERAPDGTIDAAAPGNDYRVLQPRRVMDANRNRSEVAFDALGMVVATAVMGKPGESHGDSLDGAVVDLPPQTIIDHLAHPLAAPHLLLGRATTRVTYDLWAYRRTRGSHAPEPAAVLTVARAIHDAHLPPDQDPETQCSVSYSDGFGHEIQQKTQAEPGPVPDGAPPLAPRWVGSGWTVFNNKGKPVRRYEPFFTSTHGFEFGVEHGVSSVVFYDPLDRVVATLHPKYTYDKVRFDAWTYASYDVNDTVAPRGAETGDPATDPDIGAWVGAFIAAQPSAWQTWYARRQDGVLGPKEQAAALQAAEHADTPTTSVLDGLGRPFLTLEHNGYRPDGTPVRLASRRLLDIQGNERAVRDAVAQHGDSLGRVVMRSDYDLLGNRLHQVGMDAGHRWTLSDAGGAVIRAWDSRGHAFRTQFDSLRRPVRVFVADGSSPARELLTERLVYGEQHPECEARNLRGSVHLHFDQAGVVSNDAYDFKGNLLAASRRLAREYRDLLDWRTIDARLPADFLSTLQPAAVEQRLLPLLEDDTFTSSTTYDALNRPVTLISPHTTSSEPCDIRLGYNEASLLQRVDVHLHGALAPDGEPAWTPFVTDVDYDAKGQRRRIDYGNGATTNYDYDPLTFRLIRLHTRRDRLRHPNDCQEPASAGWPGCDVQDLHYTYDPAGNVTYIADRAQQTVFFRNKRVEPDCAYTYDALYRLVKATGRELVGHAGAPVPHSHDDATRVSLPWSANDGTAMATYTEEYVHDAVGNLLEFRHRGSDPALAGWTRAFSYDEESLIEDGQAGAAKTGNRLTATTTGTTAPQRHLYDHHGNTVRMPHLGGTHPAANVAWDHADRMRRADLGGGGTAYYVYDSAGARVRKVWEKKASLVEERIYLGGFEIFRRRKARGRVALERVTLHVKDDQQRIALIETRTPASVETDDAPEQLIRYQIGNHLGSAALELDDEGGVISYEEYTPYGSTSYQAVRSQTETPKHYRFSGKERDEETGLNYHGARYYAPWLGRWTSTDPAGLVDGPNSYAYCRSNPVVYRDPSGTQGGAILALGAFEDRTINIGGQNVPIPDRWAGIRLAAQETLPNANIVDLRAMSSYASAFEDLGGMTGKWEKWKGIPSATVVQEALEGGNGIRGIHFDTRGVEVLRPGSHVGSELRSVLADLASRGGSKVDVYLRHDGGTSFIRAGATVVEGAPLPQHLASHLPPSFSQPPAGAPPRLPPTRATGPAGGGGNNFRARVFAATGRTLDFVGNGAAVVGSGVGGYQIGTGLVQLAEGQTGEGALTVAEGVTNTGLAIGTTAGVKSGAITAEAGLAAGGTTALAGVAAAGSVALAFEEGRRAFRGERTMAAEALDAYLELIEMGQMEGGAKGLLMQAGGYLGAGFAGVVAVPQGYRRHKGR